MRCSGVQYRCIFLLVLCILTRPAGSSKYCRTRKNIQRYCSPKHPIRYIDIYLRPNWHEQVSQPSRIILVRPNAGVTLCVNDLLFYKLRCF